jgi:hypothetical protein
VFVDIVSSTSATGITMDIALLILVFALFAGAFALIPLYERVKGSS